LNLAKIESTHITSYRSYLAAFQRYYRVFIRRKPLFPSLILTPFPANFFFLGGGVPLLFGSAKSELPAYVTLKLF